MPDSVSAAPSLMREPQPRALLFNLEPTTSKGAAIHELLAAVGVDVRDVACDELGLTVGYLAGLPGFSAETVASAPPAEATGRSGSPAGPSAGDVPDDEFMLMCHMPDDKVIGLMRVMRAANVPVGCVATLTEFNRSWQFGNLVCEVAKEHAAMEKYRAEKAAGKAAGQAAGD